MKNPSLTKDYITRAKGRLVAIDALFGEKLWADVVRESQEVVELALKALLRFHHIEVPKIHDVSAILEENQSLFPKVVGDSLEELIDISQDLRRDRELAFYGSEDITPMEFYKKKHAEQARMKARKVVSVCEEACR